MGKSNAVDKAKVSAVEVERVSVLSSLIIWIKEKTEKFGFVISKTERRFALTLLLPAVVVLAVVGVFPAIYCGWLSATNINLARAATGFKYIGFHNWEELLHSPYFWNSFGITMLFMVAAVCVEFALGLGIALVFAGKLRSKFLRTIMLIPMIMAPVVVGLSFYYIYDGFFGIVPWALRKIGLLGGVAPLGKASIALWAVIAVDIWQWTPFMVLILLAGLESLPVAPYEAAQVDNASRWRVFTKITLPMLKPVILIAILLRVIDAFKVFDKIYVLTAGGPSSATEVLSMWTYRKSFLLFNVSLGATVSLIMLYVVLLICVLLNTVLTMEKRTG